MAKTKLAGARKCKAAPCNIMNKKGEHRYGYVI